MNAKYKTKTLLFTTAVFATGILAAGCSGREINSTESLMRAIVSRYHGKSFTGVSFSETVEYYENGSLVKTEIWDEEYRFPSNLVIYMTPGDTSNRYICRNDSILIYENGVLTHSERKTHDVIILSMDIFNMTFPEIMSRLKDLEYDTDRFLETTRNGRQVYVIGDTTDCHAWFDAEHLYPVRVVKQTEQGVKETELLNYVRLEKGWIGQEVIFKLNGTVYMKEQYFNIKIQ
jgi:hypothetical protein